MSEKTIVYSRDGEYFHEEPELVDEMREEWKESKFEPDGYYTGEQKDIDVAGLVSDIVVEDILNGMDQALYHIVGEVSEDALNITDEKKAELKDIITKFMRENCSCSCWAVENVKYHSFTNEGIE